MIGRMSRTTGVGVRAEQVEPLDFDLAKRNTVARTDVRLFNSGTCNTRGAKFYKKGLEQKTKEKKKTRPCRKLSMPDWALNISLNFHCLIPHAIKAKRTKYTADKSRS